MKHKILENRNLGNAFSLKIERNDIKFKAGQHVELNSIGSPFKRPYSIYSGEKDDYLEFLIKEIINGDTSPVLKELKSGDFVEISEIDGAFTIEEKDLNKKFYFICTGTGIAPFRSFIKTYPNLNYTLVHGVKTPYERYDQKEYKSYISCLSQLSQEYCECLKCDCIYGRVTDYFKFKDVETDALFYLCGLGQMIYDMDYMLICKGVPSNYVLWEVYHAERI
jgi:ferredoxin-NADP reductase